MSLTRRGLLCGSLYDYPVLTTRYTSPTPTYRYFPDQPVYYPDQPMFVSCNLPADLAEDKIREFAEYQFREKSYSLRMSPLERSRSSIYINTAKMMAIWRSSRLDPVCRGVNFTLGYDDKIVAYDEY